MQFIAHYLCGVLSKSFIVQSAGSEILSRQVSQTSARRDVLAWDFCKWPGHSCVQKFDMFGQLANLNDIHWAVITDTSDNQHDHCFYKNKWKSKYIDFKISV